MFFAYLLRHVYLSTTLFPYSIIDKRSLLYKNIFFSQIQIWNSQRYAWGNVNNNTKNMASYLQSVITLDHALIFSSKPFKSWTLSFFLSLINSPHAQLLIFIIKTIVIRWQDFFQCFFLPTANWAPFFSHYYPSTIITIDRKSMWSCCQSAHKYIYSKC